MICHEQPLHVNKNVSFVIDMNSLDDPNDLKADENGVRKRMGSLLHILVFTRKKELITYIVGLNLGKPLVIIKLREHAISIWTHLIFTE